MKHTTPLSKASRTAEAIVRELSPACERIEVAGSIRRECMQVGDIEIVCIARMASSGLFGQSTVSMLDEALGTLQDDERLRRLKGGERYRQYEIARQAPLCLDLYTTTPERWAETLLIRTGPAAFAKAIVTPQAKGGILPDELDIREGRVWPVERDPTTHQVLHRHAPIDTPDEADVFDAIGLEYIPPQERDEWIRSHLARKGVHA